MLLLRVGLKEVPRGAEESTKGFRDGLFTSLLELGCGLSLSKTALS